MATFSVKDVYNITGQGILLVGQVLAGPLQFGMNAEYSGYRIQINKISANRQSLMEAKTGESVVIGVSKVSGPIEPEPTGFALFRKDKYAEIMKTLKGKNLEFL